MATSKDGIACLQISRQSFRTSLKVLGAGSNQKNILENQLQKYSLESDSEETVQWTEKEIGTEIDKPEAEVIKVTLDLDDYLCFDVYGVSESQFEEYMDLCKERGYTKDADKDEDSYDAERDDGYSVSIDYDQTDCIMDVSVSK